MRLAGKVTEHGLVCVWVMAKETRAEGGVGRPLRRLSAAVRHLLSSAVAEAAAADVAMVVSEAAEAAAATRVARTRTLACMAAAASLDCEERERQIARREDRKRREDKTRLEKMKLRGQEKIGSAARGRGEEPRGFYGLGSAERREPLDSPDSIRLLITV